MKHFIISHYKANTALVPLRCEEPLWPTRLRVVKCHGSVKHATASTI